MRGSSCGVMLKIIVGLMLLIAPVYSYRLSDVWRSQARSADSSASRISSHYGQHLHPSLERAQSLQASLWQETQARAAQEGRFRNKVGAHISQLVPWKPFNKYQLLLVFALYEGQHLHLELFSGKWDACQSSEHFLSVQPFRQSGSTCCGDDF